MPHNRNGALFPRKINGRYAMLSRPSDTGHTNDSADHLAAIASLGRRYPRLAGIEIMPYHAMGNEKARRVGMPAPLNLPNASPADKQRWQSTLTNHGCTAVMAD